MYICHSHTDRWMGSPNFLMVKFYNFTLKSLKIICCGLHCVSSSKYSCCPHFYWGQWSYFELDRQVMHGVCPLWPQDHCQICHGLHCVSSSRYGCHPHFYWGQWSYFKLDRQVTHGVCPLWPQDHHRGLHCVSSSKYGHIPTFTGDSGPILNLTGK